MYKYHIGAMQVQIVHTSPLSKLSMIQMKISIMFFDKRGNTAIPPLPYKVPKLHPCDYYKTSGPQEIIGQVSKAKPLKELK